MTDSCYQARVPAREDFLEVRGLRHRILRWGPAEAPPIFLLHGFQDCADTFQFLVDEMPQDRQFIAPDWRGFGGSAQNNGPYWFADYLADLEALLDQLSPQRPAVLVGHSMGGNVAGLYAGVRPERVSLLISLEGFGLQRSESSRAPDRFGEWLDELRAGPRKSFYESTVRLAGYLQRRNPRLPLAQAEFIARAWTRPVEGGGFELRFDPWHRLINPVLYRRDEAEACWRRVRAATLLLVGGQSEYRERLENGATGDEVRRFRECFAQLDWQAFPQLGHMMHHEDAAAVATVISSWLQRHESPATMPAS